MKRFHVFVSLALVLGLGSVTFGAVIADFEGGLDGWIDKDATIALSTVGVTHGSSSIVVDGVGGWHIDTLADAKAYRDMLGTPGATISADVTVFPEDITSGWMQVQMIINGQNNDDNGPQDNIGWQQPAPQLQDVVRDGLPHTYTWELSEELTTAIAGIDDNIAWFELVLVTNLDEASPMTMYVDNIQVQAVPEPAAIILLAIGGLALLGLRRRK